MHNKNADLVQKMVLFRQFLLFVTQIKGFFIVSWNQDATCSALVPSSWYMYD